MIGVGYYAACFLNLKTWLRTGSDLEKEPALLIPAVDAAPAKEDPPLTVKEILCLE
jgi:hypothetical protein